MSLLAPGRGLRGAAPEDLAHVPARLGWKIAAEVLAPDGPREVATWSEGGGRRVEVDGKAATQTALGRVLRILGLTPAMDRLWLEGAGERRRFLDRLTLSLLPDHGEVAAGYDRALRERNRLLRDGVRDPAWFEALEGQMALLGARLSANREGAVARLGAAGAADGFPAADLALEGESPRDEDGLREALRAGRVRDMAAGRSLTGPHRDDLGAVYAAKGVPARLCSTGEQKALLISLILSNARAVASDFGRPPVLLLDEITAHLDAGRRAALFEAILGIGAQAFLTGTGPELFGELGDRAAHLEMRETAGESRASFVPSGA